VSSRSTAVDCLDRIEALRLALVVGCSVADPNESTGRTVANPDSRMTGDSFDAAAKDIGTGGLLLGLDMIAFDGGASDVHSCRVAISLPCPDGIIELNCKLRKLAPNDAFKGNRVAAVKPDDWGRTIGE
jgi:hypothetical protein